MESKISFSDWRERLLRTESPEELAKETQKILKAFPNRYHILKKYLADGNKDIEERLAFLKKHTEGDFCDIGSYDGFFVFELEKKGFRAIGLDMMEEALNISESERKYYPGSKAMFLKGFAEKLPFDDESFDTTLLSHTLEHTFDPMKCIHEAARVTKKSGKIIAIVPTELGNEPTHLRLIESNWLELELSKYGSVSSKQMVGYGIAYICQLL